MSQDWRQHAFAKGWKQEDVELFLRDHPEAKDVRFEKDHLEFTHVSVFRFEGTGCDGATHVSEAHMRRTGTWLPPREHVEAPAFGYAPFEGKWCPCHGPGGCPPKIMERGPFCGCLLMKSDDPHKRFAPVDGRKGVHSKVCPLYSEPKADLPPVEWPDDNGIVDDAPVAAVPPEPIPAPVTAPRKRVKKQKRVIESLELFK